jgi:hypothetical protein
MGRRSVWALLLVPGLTIVALLAACTDDSEPLVASDIVSGIPWGESEVTTYRVTQDDIEGECVLSITEDGANVRLGQACEGEGFTDLVSFVADSETLQPVTTLRTITGPDGEVTCEAGYDGSSVTVQWVSPDDERENDLAIPEPSYDTWGDLFLWRTIAFGEDYDRNYVDVASCNNPRKEPELVGIRLTVEGVEEVEVPQGTYEAWHLRIRSEGHTQDAWFSTEDDRLLVKYDNGDQVFELTSIGS